MKRTKLLLSTIASFLLAFVMVFAAACNNNGDTGSVRPAPQVPEKPAGDLGITEAGEDDKLSLMKIVVVESPRDIYQVGDEFESTGIRVRAYWLDSSIEPDPLDPDANIKYDWVDEEDLVIDPVDFNSSRVGVYNIYVSYTYRGVMRLTSYPVTVKAQDPVFGGIVAKLADGKSDTYSLSAGQSSVIINKDILAVYAIGTNGEAGETALDPELYDADLYLGTQKMTDNAATQNGVYSFVATLKSDKSQQDYIPVYVVNAVSAIELDTSATGGVFEQVEGKDTISSTWTFKVTYSNGTTKTVKAGDAGLTITLDTTVVGENKTASVKYVENDSKGTPHEVTCTVTYTVTEKVVTGDSVDYVMYYTVKTTDADQKTGSFVTTYGEASGEDNDNNVTMSNSTSNFLTREKSTSDNSVTLSDYTEIKEGGNKNVTITVGANAKNVSVKVYVSHTSSSSARTAYIASATTTDDASKIVDSKTVGGTDGLSTSNLHALEGTLEAGTTYHVFTSGSSDTMHLYQVVVTYTIEGQGGGGETLPATITVTSDEVTGYPSDGTLTESLAWGNSGILTVLAGCKVNSSKKTVDGADIANRLQSAGAATTTGKSIEIDLTGSEYSGLVVKVRVVFYVGSADTRYLLVLGSDGNEYTTGTKPEASRATSEQFDETVTLQGGAKYYLGGSNGINIYKVVITFEKA